MSAEVEEQVKEEQVKEVKRPLIRLNKSRRSQLDLSLLVLKIVELLLCIICMSLIYEPLVVYPVGRTDMNHMGVMYTAITGYMIINGVLLLSRLIGDQIPYRTASLFAILGSALFLTTGILLSIERSRLTKNVYYSSPRTHPIVLLTIAIVLIFVNFIVFAVDAVANFAMHIS